jgi:hypothetical protein
MTEQQRARAWDRVLITGITMIVLGFGMLFLQAIDMIRSNRLVTADAEARVAHEQYVVRKFSEVFSVVKATEARVMENRARIDALAKKDEGGY